VPSLQPIAIDRGSAVPLYYQIQQSLLGDIRTGALGPGEPVPSEQEISERLRVSRMTARQALKSLCDMGVVFSQRGKGTFVSPLKLEKNLRQVISFTDEMRARGFAPSSTFLSLEAILPGREVWTALGITPKQKVYRLKRIRNADSVPLGIECSYLPAHRYPDLPEKFNRDGSLYRTLIDCYGVHIHVAEEVAEASLVDARQGRLLHVKAGSPIFIFARTSYDRSGRAVEYVRSVYRGDRYKIVNRLTQHSRHAGRGKHEN
jgi:GntR family transcriptional regulator